MRMPLSVICHINTRSRGQTRSTPRACGECGILRFGEAILVIGGTDARNAAWVDVASLPRLAFDHKTILQTALERLRAKIRYQPIGFELLPPKFTLGQLQRLYEAILGRELDKRNFSARVNHRVPSYTRSPSPATARVGAGTGLRVVCAPRRGALGARRTSRRR